MQALVPRIRRGDDQLWMIAVGFSLLLNAAFFIGLGVVGLESTLLEKPLPSPPQELQGESVAMIFPEVAKSVAETRESVPVVPKRFVRTSADQAASPDEKNTLFIGERDTQAVSEKVPVRNAPPLASQSGIQPHDKSELETTQSAYRDGPLTSSSSAPADPAMIPVPPAAAKSLQLETSPDRAEKESEKSERTGTDVERSLPSAREAPMGGPNPVDVQVPRVTQKDDKIKPTPEKVPATDAPPPPNPIVATKSEDLPKAKPVESPSFKGNQRKTAIVGCISREGRSSLAVSDTPLGRYAAVISRAVEQEWRRNCVRHRDFITPGFLTVRFSVEPGGKVRAVQFIGDMETGEIQKGFTLNSIRNAEIPAMPPALAKEYSKEPLELVYNFYF